MFESTAKKALRFYVVNANACDATRLQPDSLQGYDTVVINANTLITNPAARAVLADRPVVMNVNNHADLTVDGPVEVTSVNGRSRVHPGMAAPALPTYLQVNGTLEIAPGSEEVLRHYCGFQVNGTIVCPQSIAALLGSVQLNGRLETYPDDCICLKPVAVLDKAFVLRARQGARYYAARRMVALDGAADYAALAAKGVQLVTDKLLVADSLAETLVPLLDETAEVELLPDGTAFVPDDAVLDEALLRRCGGKLYLDGDLTVNRDSAPWLAQVEYLKVAGDAKVVRSLVEEFRRLNATCGRLCPTAGTVLADRLQVKVDAAMLAAAADGLQLEDCVNVTFAPDATPELLREKLVAVTDCVNVTCTPAQRTAIDAVAQDVVSFHEKEPAAAGAGAISGALDKAKGAAGELKKLLSGLGIDPEEIDLVRTLLGSKMINGNTCRL